MKVVGYYDEHGRHHCECGAFTHYRMFSSGMEFVCDECGMEAYYPSSEGLARRKEEQTDD